MITNKRRMGNAVRTEAKDKIACVTRYVRCHFFHDASYGNKHIKRYRSYKQKPHKSKANPHTVVGLGGFSGLLFWFLFYFKACFLVIYNQIDFMITVCCCLSVMIQSCLFSPYIKNFQQAGNLTLRVTQLQLMLQCMSALHEAVCQAACSPFGRLAPLPKSAQADGCTGVHYLCQFRPLLTGQHVNCTGITL